MEQSGKDKIFEKGDIEEKVMVYDYKTIKVKREIETMTCDVYANLGWELTSTKLADASLFFVSLSFKRERNIGKISGLTKIEQEINSMLTKIDGLQTKKKNAGKIGGISLGTIGILTFGGGLSLCLVKSTLTAIICGSVLAVVGVGIGLIGAMVFKKINARQEKNLMPEIDLAMDKISELCEKAQLSIINK